jgi:2-dehydropantoate 2-reductase
MRDKTHRIAVVGAGAIGGTTAAFLSKAGWNVELVCKHQDTVERAASPGLHVWGVRGDHSVKVKAVKDIEALTANIDTVLLATKATDCVEAARSVLPFIREDASVVSLQNGICEDVIADVVGPDRVIGCVVGWGATMHGPGELEVTSPGEFVIGTREGKPDDRLPRLKQMLDEVVPTRISSNIMGELYSKLIINSCINSLGVIAGLKLGKLLANRRVRLIFVDVMREAMAVAHAMNIKVEPGGGGKLDYYRFLANRTLLGDLWRHVLIRMVGFKYRRIRSSSLQSLERGRLTEVDFLNGYICDKGREYGVPTPVNTAVVKMIKQIEAGTRKIALENLLSAGL